MSLSYDIEAERQYKTTVAQAFEKVKHPCIENPDRLNMKRDERKQN